MAFDIATSSADDVLILNLTGEIGEAEVPHALKAVYDTIKKSGFTRVLIDSRQMTGRHPGSAFFQTRNLPGPLSGIRLAMLGREDDQGLAEFNETTGYNIGLRLRVFFDFDTAISWLRAEHKKRTG